MLGLEMFRFEPGARLRGKDFAKRRISAISAFSGSGTAHLLYRRRESSAALAVPAAVEV
jgi:hypothetical protein